MAWIENGPVSLPRGGPLAFAVVLLVGAAVVGTGFGFSAGWRGGAQRTAEAIDANQDIDQAVEAKPLITIGPPPAPPAAASAPTNAALIKKDDDADEDTNDIEAKTAAVQAVQSKPAQKAPDIDDLLASPTEKPQAPAKSATDEEAPPAKTDVPF